jgi:hypothetical protein
MRFRPAIVRAIALCISRPQIRPITFAWAIAAMLNATAILIAIQPVAAMLAGTTPIACRRAVLR